MSFVGDLQKAGMTPDYAGNITVDGTITSNGDKLIITNTTTPQLRVQTVTGDDDKRSFFAQATATSNFISGSAANDTVVRGRADGRLVFGCGFSGTKLLIMNTTSFAFHNQTPVARHTGFTQTYSTASSTHAARTAATLTDSSGGSADTTVAAVSGSGADSTINDNFADLTAQVNALLADQQNTAQVLNELIDYLQSRGDTQ